MEEASRAIRRLSETCIDETRLSDAPVDELLEDVRVQKHRKGLEELNKRGKNRYRVLQLSDVSSSDTSVVVAVKGVPADQLPAFRFSDIARKHLAHKMTALFTPEGRDAMILDWARNSWSCVKQ